MNRLWKWLAEAPKSRAIQVRMLPNREFEATCMQSDEKYQTGVVVCRGTGKTGDGAIVNCAIDLMNKLDKPAGAAMPL